MSNLDKHIQEKLEPIMNEIDGLAERNVDNAKILADRYVGAILKKWSEINDRKKLHRPPNLN